MGRNAQDIYSRPGHLIRGLQLQIAVAVFHGPERQFFRHHSCAIFNSPGGARITPASIKPALMKIIAFDHVPRSGTAVKLPENKRAVRRVVSDADRRTENSLTSLRRPANTLLSKVKKSVDDAQKKMVTPLGRVRRRSEFMRMMHKLVQLNNDPQSRSTPSWPTRSHQQTSKPPRVSGRKPIACVDGRVITRSWRLSYRCRRPAKLSRAGSGKVSAIAVAWPARGRMLRLPNFAGGRSSEPMRRDVAARVVRKPNARDARAMYARGKHSSEPSNLTGLARPSRRVQHRALRRARLITRPVRG